MDITFDTAATEYIQSKKFRKLAYNSKRNYMNGIDSLEPLFSGKWLDEITRPKVIEFRDTHYDMPGRCRVAMSTLNNILKFAYDRGNVSLNVAARSATCRRQRASTAGTRVRSTGSSTVLPATVDAMMLALYTGQRRSDLVHIEWSDYNGTIHVVQRKTGVEVWIPVHPKLKAHLEAMRKRVPKTHAG